MWFRPLHVCENHQLVGNLTTCFSFPTSMLLGFIVTIRSCIKGGGWGGWWLSFVGSICRLVFFSHEKGKGFLWPVDPIFAQSMYIYLNFLVCMSQREGLSLEYLDPPSPPFFYPPCLIQSMFWGPYDDAFILSLDNETKIIILYTNCTIVNDLTKYVLSHRKGICMT